METARQKMQMQLLKSKVAKSGMGETAKRPSISDIERAAVIIPQDLEGINPVPPERVEGVVIPPPTALEGAQVRPGFMKYESKGIGPMPVEGTKYSPIKEYFKKRGK
jgi:hypothetical protein